QRIGSDQSIAEAVGQSAPTLGEAQSNLVHQRPSPPLERVTARPKQAFSADTCKTPQSASQGLTSPVLLPVLPAKSNIPSLQHAVGLNATPLPLPGRAVIALTRSGGSDIGGQHSSTRGKLIWIRCVVLHHQADNASGVMARVASAPASTVSLRPGAA